MPNYTGAFLDQNPDVEVDLTPEEVEEVADNYPYAGVQLASARATPDVEFITLTVAPGIATKVLQNDIARVKASFWVPNSASVFLATFNVNALIGQSFPLVLPGTVPAFLLPNSNNTTPIIAEFHTQAELWLYNSHTNTAATVCVAVERYSER